MPHRRDDNPAAESLAHRKRAQVTRVAARRVMLGYALAASVWLLSSDWVITHIGLPTPVVEVVGAAKGIAFVLVTSAFLYVAGVRSGRRVYDFEERYHRLFDNAPEGILLFRAARGPDRRVVDLEVTDVNPAQLVISGLTHDQVVGCKMSQQCVATRELAPYFQVALAAIEGDTPGLQDVHFEDSDRYFLTSVYAIDENVWATEGAEVTDVRRAQKTARQQEERIRRAYVDVLDAVTGGKLVLMTEVEIGASLGEPLTEVLAIESPSALGEARRVVADATAARLGGHDKVATLTSAVGEALNNALKHAGRGTYQVFSTGDRVQVRVADAGPGIDFHNLPRATLVPGFSTAGTLGLGFTMMLQLCQRVRLTTAPGKTIIVLEIAAEGAKAAPRQSREWSETR